MPTRRITRARARGLQLVSQILLVVQLLSLGHLLSSHHVTCPEHGDIVHVEHSESSSPTAADEDVPYRRSIAPSAPAAGAEHEHCRVCADTSRRCLLTSPAPTFVHHVSDTHVVHSSGIIGFAPIELLLLSPKNSPPSA